MVSKNILILAVLLLLIAGCADVDERPETLEKDLKHYPYFFFDENSFNGLIIVDDFAPQEDIDTAKILLEHYKTIDSDIDESVIKTYPEEYWDLTEQNTILIGSCTQEPHNTFINIFVDCLSMREDQAIIRIIDNHDAWVLNVMGYSPVETRNAVEALINYEDYVMTDYHVEVIRVDGKLEVHEPR